MASISKDSTMWARKREALQKTVTDKHIAPLFILKPTDDGAILQKCTQLFFALAQLPD